MSSDCTIAFFGVRVEIADADITSLEERTHPLLIKARENGLDVYWGKFASADSYLLLVGDKLGVLGMENDLSIQVSFEELQRRVGETSARLQRAGISDRPMLLFEWQPD